MKELPKRKIYFFENKKDYLEWKKEQEEVFLFADDWYSLHEYIFHSLADIATTQMAGFALDLFKLRFRVYVVKPSDWDYKFEAIEILSKSIDENAKDTYNTTVLFSKEESSSLFDFWKKELIP